MKRIFSIEGPYYRIMAFITDLFMVNLLFLISCLTVVFSGAGLIALYQAAQRLLRGNTEGVVQLFIAEVRANLRRGLKLLGIVGGVIASTLTLLYLLSLLSPLVAPILIFVLAAILLILATFMLVFASTTATVQRAFDRSIYLVFRHIVASIAILLIPALTIRLIGKFGFYLEFCFGPALACLAQVFFVEKVEIKL